MKIFEGIVSWTCQERWHQSCAVILWWMKVVQSPVSKDLAFCVYQQTTPFVKSFGSVVNNTLACHREFYQKNHFLSYNWKRVLDAITNQASIKYREFDGKRGRQRKNRWWNCGRTCCEQWFKKNTADTNKPQGEAKQESVELRSGKDQRYRYRQERGNEMREERT